ncbi:uncharacterized protein CTRU02_213768 [Colletotrichum truncatum]|uniref:Uncharacterized protein n=1 Tax=Colletotrichum truncatum TaxID=5467 RepID=A0ACC3YGP5_COLTU
MEAAIGIVGLSIQLIDSAVKVKRVVGTYRSASTEINRLALKVERVEAICGAIKRSFEGGVSNWRCSELIETWGVCVLRSIESTLAELHGIIIKLERRASQKRGLHTVGFSFLERKDDIRRLGSCLDEDLNHLQHMMTAEIFSRCGVVEQLVLPPQGAQIVLPKRQASLLSEITPCSAAFRDHTSSVVIEKIHRQKIHRIGLLGDVKTAMVTKRSRWQQSDEQINVKESKTYSFGLRGLAYRILFSWKLDTITPISYALNVQHIVSKEIDKTRFEKLTKIIEYGNLSGLQQMLITREVTLTSFIDCMTLFEFAAGFHQPDICRFLARQNLRQCLGEE